MLEVITPAALADLLGISTRSIRDLDKRGLRGASRWVGGCDLSKHSKFTAHPKGLCIFLVNPLRIINRKTYPVYPAVKVFDYRD